VPDKKGFIIASGILLLKSYNPIIVIGKPRLFIVLRIASALLQEKRKISLPLL